ncbi:MAG: hypothetical protein D6732_10860 [Methanobacteriota archaeon]|nr:MAG: hypothetical protein D6732_10860 [Euryarchaeota archaeon]
MEFFFQNLLVSVVPTAVIIAIVLVVIPNKVMGKKMKVATFVAFLFFAVAMSPNLQPKTDFAPKETVNDYMNQGSTDNSIKKPSTQIAPDPKIDDNFDKVVSEEMKRQDNQAKNLNKTTRNNR